MKAQTKAKRIANIIFSSLLMFYCFFKSAEKIIEEKNLSNFGYKIYSQNSGIDEAKVFLIGDEYNKYSRELSSLLSCYVSNSGFILLEGIARGKNLEDFLPKARLFFLEGIKNKGIKVVGCDDIEKLLASLHYFNIIEVIEKKDKSIEAKKILLKKICEVEEERDKIFAEEIKKYYGNKKIYSIVGCLHVESNRIINFLEKKNLKYVALLPKKYKKPENAETFLKEYFERKKFW